MKSASETRSETIADVLARLEVTVEECEEMMRMGLMFYAIGAQAYAVLWRPQPKT